MSDQSTGGGSASSLMANAMDAASGAYEDARGRAVDAASRTASAAKAEALSRAEGAKDGLADQGERLAQSLRSAVDGGDDSIQAKLMAAAADSVQDLVGSLRGKSLDQLVADAGSFARRNPGAFVAAAALAGFAAARFARASAPAAEAYGDIEGTGMGSSYASPRQTGSGYAGSGYAGSGMSGSDVTGLGMTGAGLAATSATGSDYAGGVAGSDYAGGASSYAGTSTGSSEGLGYGVGDVQGGLGTSGLTTSDLTTDDGFASDMASDLPADDYADPDVEPALDADRDGLTSTTPEGQRS